MLHAEHKHQVSEYSL